MLPACTTPQDQLFVPFLSLLYLSHKQSKELLSQFIRSVCYNHTHSHTHCGFPLLWFCTLAMLKPGCCVYMS